MNALRAFALAAAVGVLLSGCSRDMYDLEQWVEEIKRRPAVRIEPLPQDRGVRHCGNLRLERCMQPAQCRNCFCSDERRALIDVLREARNVRAGVGGEMGLQCLGKGIGNVFHGK